MPDQPQQLGAPAKDPVIYTIPDQFYGLAAKAQLPREAAPVSAPSGLPGAVVPAAPPAPKKSGGKKWLLIPILAVIFLGLLGAAAWWFLRPQTPTPAPAPTVTLPPTTPAPEPQPEPQPAPATTTEEVPPPVVLDTDNDGLTDAEEALYTTNPNISDSDADGYSDSLEVVNLYNPAGFKPTKLIEAGLVKTYIGSGFELLYPSAWTPLASDDSLLSFAASESESILLGVQSNPENQSILDWYLSRNPNVSPSQLQSFTTKSGLSGVRNPGELKAYIALGSNVYVFTHSAVDQTKLRFGSTFTMMLNSFSQKP